MRRRRWLIAAAVPALVAMLVAARPADGRTAPITVAAAKGAADAHLIDPYNKLTALAQSQGAVGVYYDPAAKGFVVLTPDEGAASALTAADYRAAGAKVRVTPSAVDKATLDGVSARLRSGDFHPDAGGYRYAWGHNLVNDILEVETNAPPEVMAPLLAKYGSRMKVSYGDVGRMIDRGNDPAPHWGGAAIIPVGATTFCTAGFTVRDGAGNRYMTTAGHCADLNTRYQGQTGIDWGTVVARPPYPTYDVELIGGSSYDPFIYGGDFIGVRRPVYGADNPVLGFNDYCRSGTLTFEVCGLTVTGIGQLCDPPGVCTSGLVRFTGGGTPARRGDSGAPFYVFDINNVGVYARGSFVGRATEGGTEVGYAELWSTVSGVFGGVQIVTIFG